MVKRKRPKNSILHLITAREIRSTFGRFFAILAIAALGAGFFAGLRITTPVMVRSVDRFYQNTLFYDYRLISTLGWTEQEVEAFREKDGVRAAEGAWQYDVLIENAEGEGAAYKVHSVTKELNGLRLSEGRMPEAQDECLMDASRSGSFSIGDRIRFSSENDSDTLQAFTGTSYIITGFTDSSLYVNFERGTTSIGNGSVAGFLYLPKSSFTKDYYTEIYVKLEGDAEIFSKLYGEEMDALRADWEETADRQAENRYDDLYTKAREELDDAEAEFTEKKADGEQELTDAKAELDDAEEDLKDAERKLSDSKQELLDGEAEFADSEGKLADAKEELDAAEQKILDGESQLANGRTELSKAKQEIDANEAKLKAAAKELQKNDQKLKAAKKKLDSAEETLKKTKEELDTAEVALQSTKEELDSAEETLKSKKGELDAAAPVIDAAGEQLKSAKAELDAQKEALEASREELGEKAYAAGLAAYELILSILLDTFSSRNFYAACSRAS